MSKLKLAVIFSLLIRLFTCGFNTFADEIGPNVIRSIAFSPDGQEVAVAGGPAICNNSPDDILNYFTIRIFDAQTSKLIKNIGHHTCSVNSISWSPDGTRIVSSSDEGTAIIWDVVTGKEVTRYSGSGYGVRSLFNAVWNPIDERIVVLGGGRDIVIWDAKTGKLITRVYSVETLGATFADWSPDGMKMAVGTALDKIQIFDVDPAIEKSALLLQIDSGSMTNLIWSPDGTQVATTSGYEVHIFDAKTGKLTKTLTDSTNDLQGIAWTGVGNQIATGGDDYKVRVWDISKGEIIGTFDHEASIKSVDWSSDGRYLAFAGYANSVKKYIEIVDVTYMDK